MSRSKSLVSVIMGTRYMRDDLSPLKRAVNSILAQTYSQFEFLICDDGSFQTAKVYLEQCAQADGRIRLLRPGNRLNLAAKLNICLAAAEGDYIARMDDDDFSHPNRFVKQLTFLAEHPTTSFVGCNVELFRGGVKVGQWCLPEKPSVRDFYITQPFVHPALMFRRIAMKAVGEYSEKRRQVLCEDYDLLLRLYAKGYQGANLQETFLDYTIPETAKGTRRMSHRWNEMVTRYERFKDLGLLPGALPYVVKPLIVGLLPEKVLAQIKKQRSTGG